MMKKIKDSLLLSSIGSIINDISADIGLERGLKISSLSKLWPKIVGPRFEKTSKIYTLQQNNGFDIIIVAVSSSSVSQELAFYKKDIIRKTYKVAKDLELKIKDIQFSTKFWKEEENEA